MVSTLLIHTSMPAAEQCSDGSKSIYTPHDASRGFPLCDHPPTSLLKELMDAPPNFSDSRPMRLLTNNAQRLQTDVKGLWNSAPRSAHPTGAYERGTNYPRLFQLDCSYGLSVKELPGQQGPKSALDFRLASIKVPVKAFSDRQGSTSISNHVEPARQRARDFSDAKRRDVPIALISHRPYKDRITPADREVVTRELEHSRGWRVNAAVPHITAAPYHLKRPAEADRPIRGRSLSEASDNGRRAFRAMADWITIYLFALVESGRLPQDGAIERLPLWRSMTAFQSTRQLIHRILVATAVPHSAVFLALWYIFRLPISPQTVVYAQDTARARFRDSLKNGSAYLIEDYMMRVFTAGIMLADKWVNDQTFQLRTWHEITGIPKPILRNLEVAAMGVLEYNLRVSGNEWQMWLGHLTSWHSSLANDPIMIIDGSPLSYAIITTSLKDVVRASSRSELRGTPEPNFLELRLSLMTRERRSPITHSTTSDRSTVPLLPLPSHSLTQSLSSSQNRTAFTAPAHLKPWPGVRPAVWSF
ncbi:hypothetical protein F5148DRAFT_865260 [Russula earlei]|uniref:Uncharacterized protein n=1 Tax=Russula earlei TaxID=71964 RepID=A0ACC0UC34_9AGAM|nr:hypothetical protein F5148DRAFT_865260 [Russula earlei]